MPNGRNIVRASASTAISSGPHSRTSHSIGRATRSAMRSGALIAAVLGKISAKMMITTLIPTVA